MKNNNRYVILGLLMVIQLTIGGHYAWSIFSRELITKYGFTTTLSQVAYSCYHIFFTLAFLFGGRLLEKSGPRFTALLGGAVYGAGYFLAGSLPVSVFSLSIGIGVLGGIGSGFCYITPIATAQKWFEDKKAIATGIIVASFAFSSVLISFVSEILIDQQHLPVTDVFRILGAAFFFVTIICAAFLKNPDGYKSHEEQMPLKAILKERNIIAMSVPMFAGLFVGLMVIGSLKNIGVSKGVHLAGYAVMFISAFNGLGRVSWGWVIHKIGEEKSITIALFAQTVILFTSVFWVKNDIMFYVFAGLVGLCYACTLVAFASNVSKLYGVKHLSNIYGYMFLTNGVAGVCAPLMAGIIKDIYGSYDPAILITSGLCLVSLVFFKLMYRPVKS